MTDKIHGSFLMKMYSFITISLSLGTIFYEKRFSLGTWKVKRD